MPELSADYERKLLEAAETCARLLRDHLTGDGGFGGKPKRLDCTGCREAVKTWERLYDAALIDGSIA